MFRYRPVGISAYFPVDTNGVTPSPYLTCEPLSHDRSFRVLSERYPWGNFPRSYPDLWALILTIGLSPVSLPRTGSRSTTWWALPRQISGSRQWADRVSGCHPGAHWLVLSRTQGRPSLTRTNDAKEPRRYLQRVRTTTNSACVEQYDDHSTMCEAVRPLHDISDAPWGRLYSSIDHLCCSSQRL